MMAERKKVKLPSGFKDYLPEEERKRSEMLDAIKRNFELFGFVPLDTPGVEEEQTLTGGDPEFKKQIFKIKKSDESESLALRFDLTVPLARVVSMYPNEITFPFKRYQIGKVWRGERAQAGRFREFLQFDADVVGSGSLLADAEIVALMNQVMISLGFQNFLIKINNRKILGGLPNYVGFSKGKLDAVLRTVDKWDKIGIEGVLKELSSKNAAALSKNEARRVVDFFGIKASNNRELLRSARALISTDDAEAGFAEMEALIDHLASLGVPDDKWAFDFATVRGLAYYTGFVFETILTDLPEIGSVFSGGRYDNLVEHFGGGRLPAVGASVGVDRMLYAMEKLEVSFSSGKNMRAVVLHFDEGSLAAAERAVYELRKNGIPSEIYLGKEKTLKGQLAFAVKNNYAAAVLIGEREASAGTATIKDLKSYKQTEVAIEHVASSVKKILGGR
ncbi:histidine--tRNA ligase [Patescibacteria group bacterium]|nr:histidine--tRNA ligase [Patescibacteria group bacterium]MCL5114448.1 histidine--tRNA ligase [Patescibacteria group bacterium]